MADVVVTGAAHGIGAATARRFAAGGHRVAVLDLDAGEAGACAERIREGGGTALALGCDVTVAHDCRVAVASVVDAWGGIDILVNNAGITHVGGIGDTDVEVLRRVLDVNLFGAVHCTLAALPSLLERRGCAAVLSSVAGFAPLATRAGYVASKHALEGWFATLRAEHAADGLAVTVVRPSFVTTSIGVRALGAHGGAAGEGARTGVAHPVSPEAAARAIVRGVSARQRVVWIGREARLAWWLWRGAPALYERLMLRRTRA